MKKEFETIIKFLTGAGNEQGIISGLDTIKIDAQFNPDEDHSFATARNLNAAFLIALSGKSHPVYNRAVQYIKDLESHSLWKDAAQFYKHGLEMIHAEISEICNEEAGFRKDLTKLYSWIIKPENLRKKQETIENLRRVFFPEGVSLCEDREKKISMLREKRKVAISKLNLFPITDPAKEILFTSNILVTIPVEPDNIDNLPLSSYLKKVLTDVAGEEQKYWYDHPIPVGIASHHNEVLYGLEGLDNAVEFEKQRGTIAQDAKVSCVLSVSVTHEGLQAIVKEYLEDELKKEKNIRHLNVYIFTEADTAKLIEEVLVPAAERYMDSVDPGLLYRVIGTDGEYGRHYSFLKAIAAYWQVFISPQIKGTFKIDLDQVFPQKELVEQSGASAFEHLKTPLWGAEGIDSRGNNVELGMIAGALVNQKDIMKSLFTPDVCFPPDRIGADEMVFFSSLPQALSTEAEMMTRYTDSALDGRRYCIQRIHVTGGTCGILIDSLRKYQPFTPAFIGRAEDQAYILSVLFGGNNKNLRYVHKDGLIMRHDKEAFAGEAIKMAATGKLIGDYIRILMFSYYARALPWPLEDIKDTIDPFTGCFVSRIPLTVVCLKFSLKAASFFDENSDSKNQQGLEFLQTGIKRLHETIQKLARGHNPLIDQFLEEKQGWKLFYGILDRAEERIKQSDPFALDLQEKAKALIEGCRINFD